MSVLKVENLCKAYPSFTLDNVSFDIEPGKITGFIGRNGAGKTTTLKSILGFVHPDSGKISFFDKDFYENEKEIKGQIGFVSGGIDYYSNKKIKTITSVTKSFFPTWDDELYKKYIKEFDIDESKTPGKLSAGMKVKYSLALALSHKAKLLILDEPTSGLDPVSRDDLTELFLSLCDDGVTILFSTHITSDLDRCAHNIIYIQKGRIIADDKIKDFTLNYKLATLTDEQYENCPNSLLIGCRRVKDGYTAIIKSEDKCKVNCLVAPADTEDIMVHLEKEAK